MRTPPALICCMALVTVGIAFAGAVALGADDPNAPRIPPDVTRPLTVFDVDWSEAPVGQSPQRAGKAWLEASARDPWRTLPWRTYTHLDCVTRDRTAVVADSALGLTGKPIVFTAPDGRQPHWGPRMSFTIPNAIAADGKRWRVRLDVSIDNVTKMGGIALMGVGALTFLEDGTVRFGETELARYRPATPLHLEFIIDVPNRTCTARCNDGEPLTVKWHNQHATRFQNLRLDGLLPGGHARAPGKLAFDNINITLEK